MMFALALPVLVIVGLVFSLTAGPHLWRLRKPGVEAQAVIHLLGNDPDGWRSATHAIMHAESRIAIWIANYDYGLTWWLGGEHDYRRGEKPSKSDQKHLWRAICDWKRGSGADGVGYAAKYALTRLSRERAISAHANTPNPERSGVER